MVLLLNDHLLKGAGLLPGWLTGKLSDVAGLIVAPVLVAALLDGGRSARVLAIAAVGSAFAAIKLSASAASAVEQLTAVLGVPWKLWSDPSDLLALPALGLAWLIQQRAACAQAWTPTWLERAGVVVGALSCMATSVDYTELRTAVFLENRTYFDQRVDVYRAPPLDCSNLGDPTPSLDASQFTFEACRTIEPFERLPLDQDAWLPGSGEPQPAPGPRCDAVIVSAAGLEPTLIFWNDVEQETFAERSDTDQLESPGLYLEQVGSRLVIARGSTARAWRATGTLPASECPAERP